MKIYKRLAIIMFVLIGLSGAMNALADTYSYDPLNRLTRVVYDDRSALVYSYDAAGNITQISIPGPINGACGASNGQSFSAVPSANLCTPDDVVFPFPTSTGWNWTCQGTNGGSNSNCSALMTFLLEALLNGNGGGSISSNPSGISCIKGSATGCSAPFNVGTPVTLTAVPDITTSIFTGWSGACADEPCEISVDANKTATASFSVVPRIKLTLGATTGFETLQLAYSSAGTTIYSLNGLFSGDWMLDKTNNIVLKGGYLSDYGPTRTSFSMLSGKLTIRNGSIRVDRFKVKP